MSGRSSSFFKALGLSAYVSKAKADDEETVKRAEREAAALAAWRARHPTLKGHEGPPTVSAQPPPPPPRWTFVKVPPEAITWRGKRTARIALHGELEGYGIFVRRYRLHEHPTHGLVLSIRLGSAWTAEKREKRSKGWKTVDRKQVGRAALHGLFEPVACSWDALTSDSAPDDEPDWREDGRFMVTEYEPEPVGAEERPIVDELLMDSEEPSWQEAAN